MQIKTFVFIAGFQWLMLSAGCDALKPVNTPPTTQTPSTQTASYAPPSVEGNANYQYWIHSPMHPGNYAPITFKAKANHPSGTKQASLYVFAYELYLNSDGLPSKRPLKNHQWGLVKTWNFPNPTDTVELSLVFDKGFPAHSNVEYIFRVVDANGGTTDRLAIFDAGDSPWPDDKVLLYGTSRDSLKHKIDLCFFADTDYGTKWGDFRRDVETLIYEGYHKNNMVANGKNHWNFYYTKQQMDGKAALDALNDFKLGNATAEEMEDRMMQVMPSFMKSNTIPGIDAFGLLHKTAYSDLSYLEGGFVNFLMFNTFTSEPYSFGTAVHETGHAIFKLSDEYDGCSCFVAKKPASNNVFESMSACQTFNAEHGFIQNNCTQLRTGGYEWYKAEKTPKFATEADCERYNRMKGYPANSCEQWVSAEDGDHFIPKYGQCIMENDGDSETRQFSYACSYLINDYYQKLKQYARIAPPSQPLENMYGYEPVAMLALNAQDDGWDIGIKKVEYGVPTENNVQRNFLDLNFSDGQRVVHRLSLDAPGQMLLHGAKARDAQEQTFRPKAIVAIPIDENIENVEAKRVANENTSFVARSVVPMKSTFNLKNELNSALQKFEASKH
jgi:hypothetical protein